MNQSLRNSKHETSSPKDLFCWSLQLGFLEMGFSCRLVLISSQDMHDQRGFECNVWNPTCAPDIHSYVINVSCFSWPKVSSKKWSWRKATEIWILRSYCCRHLHVSTVKQIFSVCKKLLPGINSRFQNSNWFFPAKRHFNFLSTQLSYAIFYALSFGGISIRIAKATSHSYSVDPPIWFELGGFILFGSPWKWKFKHFNF